MLSVVASDRLVRALARAQERRVAAWQDYLCFCRSASRDPYAYGYGEPFAWQRLSSALEQIEAREREVRMKIRLEVPATTR